MSITDENPLVTVRRQWNDWKKADYRLSAVHRPHRDTESGGVRKSSPHRMLYAYVNCDGMESGELAHSCEHGPLPHSIKVCIVKKDNHARVHQELVRRAGEAESNQRFKTFAEGKAKNPAS